MYLVIFFISSFICFSPIIFHICQNFVSLQFFSNHQLYIFLLFFSHREYETGVKMTSRFGKTYSRKGGNGSSKFDEVFSNKRTTLSTKWGETTFMAKLGQKRPNFKPDIQEVPKKPKIEEENTGDPFGFDICERNFICK